MTARAAVLGLLVAAAGLSVGPASAQQSTGVPNALQGFSQNRDQPVKIEAATLEVRDKDKVATFSGDVKVVQGDTTMRCKSLLVFYDNDNKPGAMKTDKPGPGGQQAIKRLEARGGVIVTQKDQTATGAIGIFDMAKNTITLDGNVMITQGQNVLRGERLIVDVATGAARVESGSKGRVSGVLFPGSVSSDKTGSTDKKTGEKPGTREAERPSGRSAPGFPMAPRGIY